MPAQMMSEKCPACHVRHYYDSQAYRDCPLRNDKFKKGGLPGASAENPIEDINNLPVGKGSDIEDILDAYLDPEDEDYSKEVLSYEELSKNHEATIKSLREQLEDIKENGTPEQLAEFGYNISNSEEYKNMVSTILEEEETAKDLSKKFKSLNWKFQDCVDRGVPEEFDNPGQLRELCKEAHGLYDNAGALRVLLDDYEALSEEALMDSYSKRDVSDVLSHIDDSNLDHLEALDNGEPGSEEWIEADRETISSDDLSVIFDDKIKVFDEDGNEKYAYDYYRKQTRVDRDGNPVIATEANDDNYEARKVIWMSKIGAKGYALDGVEPSRKEFIAELAARAEDLNLMKPQSRSFINPESGIRIDNAMFSSSDGVTPDGTVTVATSTNPEQWGKESLGIDGVPLGVRAKAISEAYESGMNKGTVASLINGRELKVYTFEMDDKLKSEAEKIRKVAQATSKNSKEAAKENRTNFKVQDFGAPVYTKLPPDIGWNGYEVTGRNAKKGDAQREKLFNSMAIIRGQNKEDIKKEFESQLPSNKEDWKEDDMRRAMLSLYANAPQHYKESSPIVGIDLETTALTDGKARIIEVGLSTLDPKTGKMSDNLSELFDVPESHRISRGTGADHVHNISVDDIKGKRRFDDPEVQKLILDRLKGKNLMAHFSFFELAKLRGSLDGFAEAEARGEIRTVDTRNFNMNVIGNMTKSNTLESFAESNGIPYEEAHRALNDVTMMLRANHEFFTNGEFGGNEEVQKMSRRSRG